MFRQLDEEEIVFLQKLWAQARLPELPLEQAKVEFRRDGKPVVWNGHEIMPPAVTVCTIIHPDAEGGAFGEDGLAIKIGAAVRSFKDRENPIVGERIALVRAIRSDPIGLNP